ncbi:MAG: hypothetical protein ABSF59_19680 [Candidatus Sulfotelmatobacter sp.]
MEKVEGKDRAQARTEVAKQFAGLGTERNQAREGQQHSIAPLFEF